MAMVVRVKPEYNGKIAVQSSNSYNGIILSNDLSQATLVQIYNTEDELRDFLYTTYTTVGDSYAPSQIDPSLIHAYASEEITHNPVKTDYPANTVGKHLNETRGIVDNLAGGFTRPLSRPAFFCDFANSRFLDPRLTFTRNSIGTYVDRNGFIKVAQANRPRFTHDPITLESLGIWYEEPKTNLLTYSTDLLHSSWAKSGLNNTAIDTMAPNGLFTEGVTCNDLSSNTESFLAKTTTLVDSTAHSLSIFAKAGTLGSAFRLQVFGGGTNGATAKFNLLTGTFTNGETFGTGFSVLEVKMKPYKNGWYKCEIIFTSSSNLTVNCCFIPVAGTHTASAGQYLYLYGPQLVKGNDSGTYIPTGASPVTREQDIVSAVGSNFTKIFGQVQRGTILVSASTSKPTYANGKFALFLGPVTAGNNRVGVLVTSSTVQGFMVNDGVVQNEVPFNFTGNFLLAYAFSYNDAITYLNGIGNAPDNTVSVPTNLNEFRIGSDTSPNVPIKQICFWPERLSNDDLKWLTTLDTKSGKAGSQLPSNSDLGRAAFTSPEAILRAKSRQEFSIDGTGASVTRNIRRDYDFDFEIVDSSGVTLTAQPASSCTAGTDNALTFTAPLGKTLTYAITPVYEN